MNIEILHAIPAMKVMKRRTLAERHQNKAIPVDPHETRVATEESTFLRLREHGQGAQFGFAYWSLAILHHEFARMRSFRSHGLPPDRRSPHSRNIRRHP